ncbi:hypothetical protein [Streptosporangium sp. NPDC049376]|uniref:hypothetical protein n=1 Tax=Streptosporangium sp. NPDC049376 TaxID=3366192 RepID=UPI0037AD2D48
MAGAAAVLASLFATWHTRTEKEIGEPISAGTVGRHAPPAAAVLVAGAANLAVALLGALGLAVRGPPVSGAPTSSTARRRGRAGCSPCSRR